jgi:alpha-beta hydrolase superfamily lysophospholipase
MGYDTVLFDFTGAGQNERIPITIENMKEDLKVMWEWATSKYDKLCTIGLSLGGLMALITDLPGRKCAVFWAPAFSMKNAVGRLIMRIAQLRFLISKKPIKLLPATGGPALLISNDLVDSFDTMDVSEELTNFTLPTLIVQGTLDMTVRPKNTIAAFGLMPEDEKHYLELVKGAPHDFRGKFVDEYIKHTLNFLNENL